VLISLKESIACSNNIIYNTMRKEKGTVTTKKSTTGIKRKGETANVGRSSKRGLRSSQKNDIEKEQEKENINDQNERVRIQLYVYRCGVLGFIAMSYF
jgi:hypothetical protein